MNHHDKEGASTALSNYKRTYIHLKDISPTGSDTAILRYISPVALDDGIKATHIIYKIVTNKGTKLANIYVPATDENNAYKSKVLSSLEKSQYFLIEVIFHNLNLWKYSYKLNNKTVSGFKGTADSVQLLEV